MRKAREHWLTAADGWRLSVIDLEPSVEPEMVAIVGHAMMVDRRTVYRPGGPSLATELVQHGMRVLVPDLRGHGDSGPLAGHGGRWSYEQLVDDVGLYIELARSIESECPLVLVGNSLFGHLALAYLGAHPDAPVAAIAGFGVNIWNHRYNASAPRWWLKRALVDASKPAVRALGYLPVRRMRLGTNDEAADYWRAMVRWVTTNSWGADDGTDYAAGMAHIARPFLHVVSDGDRLLSHPDDALMFSAALGASREVLRLGPACPHVELRDLQPGHVEMVHALSCRPLWRHVARWLLATRTRNVDIKEKIDSKESLVG